MADVLVVGSFVMDNVARMDRFPEEGQTLLGNSIECFPGGKGANQCVTVARLGGNVEMIGKLGNDPNGEVFRSILDKEGIKADRVFESKLPTAVAQVQIDASGKNRICVIPSANHDFDFEDLDKITESIKSANIVLLQLELRLDVTEELIRRASALGKTIILNPAPAAALSPDVLGMVDYLTPNETELASLSGMPIDSEEEILAAAKKVSSMGTKNVLVTLGSKGALLVNSEGSRFVKSYKVEAVDTVAAGDSFNGAVAYKLSVGASIDEAVDYANAVGAITVTRRGAIPSLPTKEEVETFISQH